MPTDEQNDKQDAYNTNVDHTVIGLMHCLKSNIPIDLSILRKMHKSHNHPLAKSVKSRLNSAIAFDIDKNDFYDYMLDVSNRFEHLGYRCSAVYEVDKEFIKHNEIEDQDEEVCVLNSMLIENNITYNNDNDDKLKILEEKGECNVGHEDEEFNQLYSEINDSITTLKALNLVGIDETADINRFLLQIILGFIVTRSIELKDYDSFWNKKNPEQSFVSLRDLYNFLYETFGLAIGDKSKDTHDIRIHSGKPEKGYIAKLITSTFKKHRYLKFTTCQHLRDDMLYNTESENGKIVVSWDIKAIHEFDIIDLLKSFTTMICEDPYAEWQENDNFMKCITSFKTKCDEIKDYKNNDECMKILKNL